MRSGGVGAGLGRGGLGGCGLVACFVFVFAVWGSLGRCGDNGGHGVVEQGVYVLLGILFASVSSTKSIGERKNRK